MTPRDTSQEAAAAQLEVYRRMTPEARLQVALELTEMSRKLLADGIRARHPEYSDEQVRLAMIRVWLTPELYRQAYAGYPEIDP
jgi:hypothetical protein